MTVKEMRERRGKIAADMAELAKNLTTENRSQFDAMDAEQAGLKENIDRAERAEQLDAEMRQTTRPPQAPVGEPGERDAAQSEERYQQAFRNYMKYGWSERPDRGIRGISAEDRSILGPRRQAIELSDAEKRDMGTGGGNALQGTGPGFFIPVGFVNKIEEALKYYGPMLNVAEIMATATGQPLPYPTDNDTTISGEIVGEGQQVSTADVAIGSVLFGAYKFSTKLVKVSIELLQDSAFDIESYLVKKFGQRLGRILNNKFTVGTGTNEPKGLIPAATVGVSGSTTPAIIGDDNATSPDPTAQIGYIDLVNLEHSVDPLYRPGAAFMMHDGTLRWTKTLKDKYGRPLWMPGMTSGSPDTINGYPFHINNDMDQLGASKKTVAYGQFGKYVIRTVKGLAVMRLEERFADYGQVAFIGFARYDGNLLDAGTNPIKLLQQHA